MRSENMAKSCPKCCQIAKIWSNSREIVVAENDGGKRFTAMFKESGVIFSTEPYIVLADNSICLNRSAIKVV